MGHGIGIPALGEHGDGNDAADRSTQPTVLADGVHDFPQEVLVGEVLRLAGVAGTFDDLTAEALDLIGRHAAEIVIQPFAGFELLAVDEQGVWPGKRVAVLVEITKQREASVFKCRRAVVVLPVKAGDKVVHQL